MTITPTPQMTAWLDQEDAAVREHVRVSGVYLTYVSGGACDAPCCADGEADEGPPFAYTTGLFGVGHPELLLFGAGPGATAAILNGLAARVLAGERLTGGREVRLDGWDNRFVVERVPNPGDILFTANRFYDRQTSRSVPAVQLTYDDVAGRFPWEPGYSGPTQPEPGTFRA